MRMTEEQRRLRDKARLMRALQDSGSSPEDAAKLAEIFG